MRLDAIERRGDDTGPLHRLDARLKLIVALAFVVVAVATPIGSWTWLGVEGFRAGARHRPFGHPAARSGAALSDIPGARRISGSLDRTQPSGPGTIWACRCRRRAS